MAKSEETDKDMEQWSFIHSLVKSMVLNTITCVRRLRIGRHNVFIKRGNELNKPEIRQLYYMVMSAIDEWVEVHCNGKLPGNLNHVRPGIMIIFTLVDKDWAYQRLAKIFLHRGTGTKKEMEEWLENEMEINKVKEGKFVKVKREEYK